MNRSKIIASTAIASVMAASSAHAAMSVNGLFAGTLTDNDGGLASSFSTNSVYVSYSDTMDNGMGVSVAMSLTAAGIVTDVNIDTGMGTIGLGTGQDSAVDAMDGSPACFSLNACGSALGGKNGGTELYNDGDAASGNSIMYTSPSAPRAVCKYLVGTVYNAAATIAMNASNSLRSCIASTLSRLLYAFLMYIPNYAPH